MVKKVPLEQAAAEFSQQNTSHPMLFEMPPAAGRKTVDQVQKAPVHKYPVDWDDCFVDLGADLGQIKVRIVRPKGVTEKLPAILYLHGAGWVFGNAHTHDKLIRELAVRSQAVVIFPEYSLAPEAKYPKAIKQNYAIMNWIVEQSEQENWSVDQFVVAGDSVGGNMTTVLTIMSKQQKGPKIAGQLLFYPVTDANFDTPSYQDFATDYYLYKEGMKWFWDQYTTSEQERAEITASPLRASEKELSNLPAALIITGEADVLRDEGEAYARKLRAAGVPVTAARFQATIHDFVMLNALDETQACRGAMDLATQWLNQLIHK